MKRSYLALLFVLFFVTTSLISPTVCRADAMTNAEGQMTPQNRDRQAPSYDNPNLDEQDGFDESEHRRKIRQKRSEKKQSAKIKPAYPHNL